MNAITVLMAAVAVGFCSGLRAFTPVAIISWLGVWGWIGLSGSRLWFLGTTAGAVIASAIAVFELVGDKLPFTPARIQAGPLGARFLMGGMTGAAVALAGGQPWLIGAICGALAAVAGAFAGYNARKMIVKKLNVKDLLVALAEDIVTIGVTLLAISRLFNPAG